MRVSGNTLFQLMLGELEPRCQRNFDHMKMTEQAMKMKDSSYGKLTLVFTIK
jgi:hypothetical protein